MTYSFPAIAANNHCLSLSLSSQVSPDEKPYDKAVPLWLSVYVSVHFMLVLYGSDELARMSKKGLPYLTALAVVAYLVFAMTNFGLMFDLKLVAVQDRHTCTSLTT